MEAEAEREAGGGEGLGEEEGKEEGEGEGEGVGGGGMAEESVGTEDMVYECGDRVRVLDDIEAVKRAFKRGCDVKWQVDRMPKPKEEA